MKKRIFALIIVIVLLFAFQMPVFAASVQPRSEFYLVMTIIAYRGSSSSTLGDDGHACLYFYNEGDKAVQIGHWTLNSGCDMTIGTFGNRIAHMGIWYNVEAATASGFSNASDLATLTQMVDENQLSYLNTVINQNDEWAVLDNCVNFAVDVWNSVAHSSMQLDFSDAATGLRLPRHLIDKIEEKGGHSKTFSMNQKSTQTIAYHTTSGYTYHS